MHVRGMLLARCSDGEGYVSDCIDTLVQHKVCSAFIVIFLEKLRENYTINTQKAHVHINEPGCGFRDGAGFLTRSVLPFPTSYMAEIMLGPCPCVFYIFLSNKDSKSFPLLLT